VNPGGVLQQIQVKVSYELLTLKSSTTLSGSSETLLSCFVERIAGGVYPTYYLSRLWLPMNFKPVYKECGLKLILGKYLLADTLECINCFQRQVRCCWE
jgi:hypothetical protein